MLAALASAAMPGLAVSGVYESKQSNYCDDQAGIDHAIVQDNAGRHYDIFATSTREGRTRLSNRAKAARALERSRELSALGFQIDHVAGFSDTGKHSPTGNYCVLVTTAVEGEVRPLKLLTLDDCASVGTALAAIHRQNPELGGKGRSYSTGQIRSQLTSWIQRLRRAGHVPTAITSSWSKIIETDGLWSFSTCFVHGGLSDGDLLFTGSTITAITNWQNMQINDPARDLAWIFAKLNEAHRDALMSAYGRMMGARLDPLILLRANLWLQMEQVGDFIEALCHADTPKIMNFKAQVERLAHQLTVVANRETAEQSAAIAATEAANANKDPVKQVEQAALPSTKNNSVDSEDKTGSAEITKRSTARRNDTADDTISRQIKPSKQAANVDAMQADDSTGDSVIGGHIYPDMPKGSSLETMVLSRSEGDRADGTAADTGNQDSIPDSHAPGLPVDVVNSDSGESRADDDGMSGHGYATSNPYDGSSSQGGERRPSTATLFIPILEEQERALRDAQEGLEEYEEYGADQSKEIKTASNGSEDQSNSNRVSDPNDSNESDGSDGTHDSSRIDAPDHPNPEDRTATIDDTGDAPGAISNDTPETA